MGETFPDTAPSAKPPEDRLDSWKEIAAYLNRDVTTVQRWEKREGMPVHRHLHEKAGSVYAFRADLDAWTRTRNSPATSDNGNDVSLSDAPSTAPSSLSSTSRPNKRIFGLLLAAAVALAGGAIIW